MGALARMSLDAISRAIAKDDSTSSRVRSGEARLTVGELCDLIDAAELKLVSRDRVCVDRKKYEALATLAAAAMSDEETVAVTYTRAHESGASLKAAGFKVAAHVPDAQWPRAGRGSKARAEQGDKIRWERAL